MEFQKLQQLLNGKFLARSSIVLAYGATPALLSFSTRLTPMIFIVAMLLGLLSIRLSDHSDLDYWRAFFRQLKHPLALSVFAFVGAAFASIYWSIDPQETRAASWKLLGLVAASLLWLPCYRFLDTVWLVRAAVAGVLIGITMLVFQYYSPLWFRETYMPEVHVALVNRGVLTGAIFAAVALCLWKAGELGTNYWWRVLFVGVCLAAAVLSYSSSAVLFWLLFLLLAFSASFWSVRKFYLLGGLFVVSLFAFPLMIGFWLGGVTIAEDGLIQSAFPQTAIQRFGIWKDYLAVIREMPVFGAGYATEASYGTLGDPFTHLSSHRHPHSLQIQLWANMGLLGAVLFAVVVVCFLLTIRSLPVSKVRQATMLCVPLALIWTISHGAWQGWWLATIVLALTPIWLTSLPDEAS